MFTIFEEIASDPSRAVTDEQDKYLVLVLVLESVMRRKE
jgi:hypothetical protein